MSYLVAPTYVEIKDHKWHYCIGREICLFYLWSCLRNPPRWRRLSKDPPISSSDSRFCALGSQWCSQGPFSRKWKYPSHQIRRDSLNIRVKRCLATLDTRGWSALKRAARSGILEHCDCDLPKVVSALDAVVDVEELVQVEEDAWHVRDEEHADDAHQNHTQLQILRLQEIKK